MLSEYLILLAINILLALSDSFRDNRNKKTLSKVIEVVALSSIALYFYYTKLPIHIIVISGVFARFGVFNITYNLTSGLSYWYLGTTSIVDKIIKKLMPGSTAKSIIWLWYLLSACIGFGVIFNYLN